MRARTAALVGLLLLPIAGLVLLLAVPELDVRWEHHPSHFWLVLGVAAVNVVLGALTSEAATQRDDARLFLVSLALLSSAGFLALHALATPGVLLDGPNQGFTIATPVGLLIASGFAAASALLPDGRAAISRNAMRWMRGVLVLVLLGWAVASLARVQILSRPPSLEAPVELRVIAPLAIAPYVFAAVRYLDLYRKRGRILPLAIAVAFVLLAEAMGAVAFGRSWHLTWWEWHVLMALAFGSILVAERVEYRHEGSVAGSFGGVYLERTLERIDRRHSEALGELVVAIRLEQPLATLVDRLRRQGFTTEEISLLERSARELSRVDSLLRSYVGPRLAERLEQDPELARLGGREADVSVLFADLAGFTAFSQDRPPGEVIEMINAYWEAVVPVIAGREGGLIERFAGDAVMAVFNALGDQPDHPTRAARAALALRDVSEAIASVHAEWPRFRIGVNTGRAVIGNVGTGDQRSFSAIGDTTNVAARLQALADPGRVLVSAKTQERIGTGAELERLGPVLLKGKMMPMEVYELVALE